MILRSRTGYTHSVGFLACRQFLHFGLSSVHLTLSLWHFAQATSQRLSRFSARSPASSSDVASEKPSDMAGVLDGAYVERFVRIMIDWRLERAASLKAMLRKQGCSLQRDGAGGGRGIAVVACGCVAFT